MNEPLSILIIDDNEEDRYILRRLISKCIGEVKVHDCINGQDALDYLNKISENDFPQKIFLDINMPVLGGFEFLEAFKSLRLEKKILSNCHIAMFSTSQDYDEKKKALAYEFVVDYIEKMPGIDKIKNYLTKE